LNDILIEHYAFLSEKLAAQSHGSPNTDGDKFQQALVDCLKSKNIVLIQQNGNFELASADKCIRHINNSDTIDKFIYKLPSQFSKRCWNLFNQLGASDTMTIHRCQHILSSYFSETQEQQSGLSEEQFKSVLIILKFFLFGKKINLDFLKLNQLYMPNMLRQMVPLSSMYYIDNVRFERLISHNCQQIKSIVLFDIADLIGYIENALVNIDPSNDENREEADANEDAAGNECNILKSLGAFKRLTWPRLFQNLKLTEDQAPKPLSSILVEQMAGHLGIQTLSDSMTTNRLHSNEFAQSLVEIVRLLSKEISIGLANEVDFELFSSSVLQLMRQISVYETEEIKTVYFNLRTNKPVENSEQKTSFACLKLKSESSEPGEIQFLIEKSLVSNDLSFLYLAETILTEMKGMFDTVAALRPFYDVAENKSIRLLYFLVKLLQVDENKLQSVLDDYKIYSFFNN
jgi:hypothetical protein